ncbi:hypothetical protein VTP01DRAFT_1724 [Rhizomucor pusillus]|uniref:uncharacterized protein n=1 Tax=Rhizomucor pusillus TaxID=4840 RepID=UPI0037445C9D
MSDYFHKPRFPTLLGHIKKPFRRPEPFKTLSVILLKHNLLAAENEGLEILVLEVSDNHYWVPAIVPPELMRAKIGAHDFGQELRNRERTILNLTNYIWALYKRGDNIGVGIIIRDFDFHLQAQENVNRGQDLAFEPNVQRWLAESRMLFPGELPETFYKKMMPIKLSRELVESIRISCPVMGFYMLDHYGELPPMVKAELLEEEELEDMGDSSSRLSLPTKGQKRTITRKRQRDLEDHEKKIMKKRKRDENPVTEQELLQQWEQIDTPVGGRVPLRYALQLELLEVVSDPDEEMEEAPMQDIPVSNNAEKSTTASPIPLQGKKAAAAAADQHATTMDNVSTKGLATTQEAEHPSMQVPRPEETQEEQQQQQREEEEEEAEEQEDLFQDAVEDPCQQRSLMSQWYMQMVQRLGNIPHFV